MNIDVDIAVQKWYTDHFDPTELCYKYFDWSFLQNGTLVRDKVVLNLGCLYPIDEFIWGRTAKKWVAVDFTPNVIKRCVEEFKFPHMDRVEFKVADFRKLSFEDSKFDVVVDYSSSDHVRDDRDSIRSEVFRVLKPGGYHIVTYANRTFFKDDDSYNQFGYEIHMTPEAMEKELIKAGFVIDVHRTNDVRSGVRVKKPL